MACRLNLEYCTRSCGCANCPENISTSPTIVETTPEQDKYIAEIGMCGGKDDNEDNCLECKHITYCMGSLGVYARLKYNIEPSANCGKALDQFQEDAFGDMFDI